jgi:phosphoglycolate phosphatase
MAQTECIFFDLDGTLVDSKEGILNSVISAVEDVGYPAPHPESLTWILGPPIRQNLARILKTDDVDLIETATRFYRARYSSHGVFESEVYAGIFPLLESLKGKVPLYIATARPEPSARETTDHLGLTRYFDGIYGSNLDGTMTDKSKLIAHILDKHGIAPESAVMIGDREHDIHAAKKNGVTSIGILYGYGDENELQGAGADFIYENVSSLRSHLMQT